MNFEQIIKEQQDVISYCCTKYKGKINNYEYDDLYQECLMKIYDVYEQYNGKYKMSTFIKNICNNHLYNIKRETLTQSRCNHIGGKRLYDTTNYYLDSILEMNDYTDYELFVINTGKDLLNEIENDRDRDIITRILYGETQTSIGELYEISNERVRQIFKEFKENLQNTLQLLK
jgi:RNA polymerase sigma factor (sigma-70 family)